MGRQRWIIVLMGASLLFGGLFGCDGGNAAADAATPAPAAQTPTLVVGAGAGSNSEAIAQDHGRLAAYKTDALLYTGAGSWGAEVGSIEQILTNNGATYEEVGPSDLNIMTLDQFAQYGMIVFPGGSGGTEAGSLTSETKTIIRQAVREKGVSYIGFCAGAFIAVAPEPAPGKDPEYGIGIVPAPVLDYYYLENEMPADRDITVVDHTFADGAKRAILWYGGPVTPEGPGAVVAKYPNGQAAISELWSGRGFVMIAGTHPSAPQAVLDTFSLSDPDGPDFDVAWKMFKATLDQKPLAAF